MSINCDRGTVTTPRGKVLVCKTPMCVAWHPIHDRSVLAVGDADGVSIWDTDSGTQMSALYHDNGDTLGMLKLEWTDDGGHIEATYEPFVFFPCDSDPDRKHECTVLIWDTDSKKLLAAI